MIYNENKKVLFLHYVSYEELSLLLNKYQLLEVIIIYHLTSSEKNINMFNFPITLKFLLIGVFMMDNKRIFKNDSLKLPLNCIYKTPLLRNNYKISERVGYMENKIIINKYIKNYHDDEIIFGEEYLENILIFMDNDRNILLFYYS